MIERRHPGTDASCYRAPQNQRPCCAHSASINMHCTLTSQTLLFSMCNAADTTTHRQKCMLRTHADVRACLLPAGRRTLRRPSKRPRLRRAGALDRETQQTPSCCSLRNSCLPVYTFKCDLAGIRSTQLPHVHVGDAWLTVACGKDSGDCP